jgi:hypothetical protein
MAQSPLIIQTKDGDFMSTMAIHARWEFDLRIGKEKESYRDAVEEESTVALAALPVSETTGRRWFGRSMISFAIPLGAELVRWFFRIHGLPL